MITFATQDDFEDAVMAVLKQRLSIQVDVWASMKDTVVEAGLRDNNDRDYFTSSECKG